MSRRGLRPSEFKKLSDLGFSRKQADEYAQSGYTDVDDWIEGKKLNTSPEEFAIFKKSDFNDFSQFKQADEMGFELQEELEQAQGGNFPDRATWLIARESGILTHKKYLDHLAETKALDSLTPKTSKPPLKAIPPVQQPQKMKPIEVVPKSTPPPVEYFKPATSRIKANGLPEQLLKADPYLEEKIENGSKTDPESILVQAHKGASIQELLQKYPLPTIKATEFIDNPSLEQLYRFAEVLEQTSTANLEDLSSALSFIDVFETEEWLADQFDSELFSVDIEDNLIVFKPELYPLVVDKISKVRKNFEKT
ncbi:MAG: hypothetical protein HeimC3_18630 [Candidatus Heimdallarchaeota archaeon LC_3]|nr:MAG: hypothetical protein HeimC3_18630 [Candidatus Heimdallarchaeota archaeon LC_3]